MRSILIFFAVVIAALGLYWFQREEPATPNGAGGNRGLESTFDKPSIERPQTGVGITRTVQGAQGEITAHIPESLVESMGVSADFSWREGVSEVNLIKMEDAWDFDLSEIDFSKDVLCTVDGVDITADDLHTWIVLKRGTAMLNSRAYESLGRMAAEETGIPYGLSDLEWERYFDESCMEKGLPKEQVLANLSLQLQLPLDQAEGVRRNMVEAILAFFPPVETVDELPMGVSRLFTTEQEIEDSTRLGELMHSQISAGGRNVDSGGSYGAPMPAFVDPMSFLFAKIGNDIRFRRVWTALDQNMPEGALLGIYTGPLQEGVVLPPWEQGDQVEYIMLEEMWTILEHTLTRHFMETELRDVIWSKVTKAKLAQEGALPAPGKIWRTFASEYLADINSFMQLDFKLQIRGYTGRPFYRNDLAITEGILGLQEEDWQADETLRSYFDNNSFFVLGWVPDIELALFPQVNPENGLNSPSDWSRAKSEADAFLSEVNAGGSFTKLRMAQNRKIAEGFRTGFNQQVADTFVNEFGMGEFKESMAMTTQVLRQTLYRDHIDGASALRNAIVRLGEGEVSKPWKTPIGYVVARVNSAHLGKLEEEFEDVVDLVKHEHKQWVIRKWVNDHLTGAKFVPGA